MVDRLMQTIARLLVVGSSMVDPVVCTCGRTFAGFIPEHKSRARGRVRLNLYVRDKDFPAWCIPGRLVEGVDLGCALGFNSCGDTTTPHPFFLGGGWAVCVTPFSITRLTFFRNNIVAFCVSMDRTIKQDIVKAEHVYKP